MTLVRLVVAILLLAGLQAEGLAAVRSANALSTIRAVLATPESKIDFARAKLTLDKLVDPATDAAAAVTQIDSITEAIKAMAGPSASDLEKLRAVRIYLYESGAWNGFRPYGYDHGDPYGRMISHKLLSRYLGTRRGNCVSMPVLFLILADRIGVNVTLSLAPQHVFVRYIDRASGKTFNLETTSGAYPARDAWYREQMPMTDRAVASGVYLKTLTRQEDLAVLASTVLESEFQDKHYRNVIAIADEILKHYPAFAAALILKGDAYAGLIGEEFQSRYPTPADIPATLRPSYLALQRNADAAFDRVDALGGYDVAAKTKQQIPTKAKSGERHE
jgi:regulator of sirC expression with transglutaminase-like and TPR domain